MFVRKITDSVEELKGDYFGELGLFIGKIEQEDLGKL